MTTAQYMTHLSPAWFDPHQWHTSALGALLEPYSGHLERTSLEFGFGTDNSFRLNLMTPEGIPLSCHCAVLRDRVLIEAFRYCLEHGIRTIVGAKVTPYWEGIRLYLCVPQDGMRTSLTKYVGLLDPSTAIVRLTPGEEDLVHYVVEEPSVRLFLKSGMDVPRFSHATQLAQLTPDGRVSKRYLDLRPFDARIARILDLDALHVQGDLGTSRYGIMARGRHNRSLYLPLERDPDSTMKRGIEGR